MYNLQDTAANASSFGGGGAHMGFSMPVAPVGGSAMPYPVAMPMMGGGYGGGFGGGGCGWEWLIALALIGNNGFGFGGGRDCKDGVGGSAGFISLHDSINNGTQAILSSNATQSLLAAQHNSDLANCAGFLQVEKGFGDLGVNLCGQFSNLGNLVSAESRNINGNINGVERELCRSFAATNANITQVGTQGLIAEMNTQRQLSDCCCEIQMGQMNTNNLIERAKCDIVNTIRDDGNATRMQLTQSTITDLRDKLEEARLASSQCAQNQYLAGLINPPITKSVPVYGMSPIFDPVISARNFCGFNGSSFNQGNYGGNCGSGCGGF